MAVKYKDITRENIETISREDLEEAFLDGKRSLTKRYEDTQKTLKDAVDKIHALEFLNANLEAQKKQWEQERVMQQQVVVQQIGNSDKVVNSLQEEIRDIKRKLCKECLIKVR